MIPGGRSAHRALFEAALEQEPIVRKQFVVEHSGGDQTLVRIVLELLESHQIANDELFENPFLRIAALRPMQIGDEIGAYRIISELGSGGMGTVYAVERCDGVFERRSALKVIRPDQNNTDTKARFHNERRVLAKLDHPNIVRIIDGGNTEDGFPYYVMDYVEGEPIDRYCAARQMTVIQRLRLFRQVCLAVEYLHQQDVVHGDIKPSNILVDISGAPRLLDFGISQFTSDSLNPSVQPNGRKMMTLAYASPEQIEGRQLSARSDVYSLGIVLYELLVGVRPFTPTSDLTTDIQSFPALDRDPQPPSLKVRQERIEGLTNSRIQLSRTMRGDIDSIVLTALRREEQARYSSPGKLAEEVDRYLTFRPVAARTGNVVYRLLKFVRRNRKVLVAASIVLLLSTVSVILALRNRDLINAERELRQMPARAAALLGFDKGTTDSLSQLTVEQIKSISDFAAKFHDSFVEALRIKPGLSPERREILNSAMQIIQQGRDIAGADSEKQYFVAYAYYSIANLQGYPYETNLGDTQGALKSYEQAKELLNGVLSIQPQDKRSLELLSKVDARIHVMQTIGR